MTFTPLSFSPHPTATTPRFQAAHPKFGIVELRDEKQEQAKTLQQAAIGLAKLSRGGDAKDLLLQAFGLASSTATKLEIATAFAEGIEPGLDADPEKADQLLQKTLSPAGYQYMDPSTRLKIANVYLEKLAPHGEQYVGKGISIYVQQARGYNLAGRIGLLPKLVELGQGEQAKALLSDYFESVSRSFSDAKAHGAFSDGLQIVKLLGGVPVKTNHLEKEPRVLEGVQDTGLARQFLQRLIRPETPRYVLSQVLEILAFGKGELAQDKDTAKRLIDQLADTPVVREAWEKD